MPYIPEDRREVLLNDPYQARTVGEVNFVFTNEILRIWNLNPSYSTMNFIRSVITKPSIRAEFDNIFYQIPKGSSGLGQDDIRAALDNAWDEFYHRIGRPYEDIAIERNGDLEAYKKAATHITSLYSSLPEKVEK